MKVYAGVLLGVAFILAWGASFFPFIASARRARARIVWGAVAITVLLLLLFAALKLHKYAFDLWSGPLPGGTRYEVDIFIVHIFTILVTAMMTVAVWIHATRRTVQQVAAISICAFAAAISALIAFFATIPRHGSWSGLIYLVIAPTAVLAALFSVASCGAAPWYCRRRNRIAATVQSVGSKTDGCDHGFIYAGFWLRSVAAVIDAVPLLLIAFIGRFVVKFLLIGVYYLLRVNISGVPHLPRLYFGIVLFATSWIYFACMESSSWQGTFGKQVLDLIVTDIHGNRIGFRRASKRHFMKMLSAMPLLAGFWATAFTRKKQAWHDIAAGCIVVSRLAVNDGIRSLLAIGCDKEVGEITP